MGGSLAAVGAGFAASLGHVLWVTEAWVGITVTACTAVFAVLCLVATHGQQQPLNVVVTDDAEREHCPWCDTHACNDSTLCNCTEGCGSWICEAKETSRG